MNYKPPISLKDYKKKVKRDYKKSVTYHKKEKVETTLKYEVKKDLYMQSLSEYNFLLINVDVYNKNDRYIFQYLEKNGYGGIKNFDLILDYGDLRNLGSVKLIETKGEVDIILLITDKGENKIEKDYLRLCLERLKDLLPSGSKLLCGLYGTSDDWSDKSKKEFLETISHLDGKLNVSFYIETNFTEKDYYTFATEYIERRKKFTIFAEDFCRFLDDKKTSEIIFEKLHLSEYIENKNNGKKKDKFDF